MTDSDKPVPKKVIEKEVNQPAHTKSVLKPPAKKVHGYLGVLKMNTALVRCVCEDPNISSGWCFIHGKFISTKVKAREELIAATQADVEDEILDSSEQQDKTPDAKKRKANGDDKVVKHFADEDSCVYKWKDIQVGRKYKAMSVGNQSRTRTGMVLVPLDDI
jgi:hypothetical protein